MSPLQTRFPNLYRWRKYLFVIVFFATTYLLTDLIGRILWHGYLSKLERLYEIDFKAFGTENFYHLPELHEIYSFDWEAMSDKLNQLAMNHGWERAEELRLSETDFLTDLIPSLRNIISEPAPTQFLYEEGLKGERYEASWWQFYKLWNRRCSSLGRANRIEEIIDAVEIGLPVGRKFAFSDYDIDSDELNQHFQNAIDIIHLGLSKRKGYRQWDTAQLERLAEILGNVDLYDDLDRLFLIKVWETHQKRPGLRSEGTGAFLERVRIKHASFGSKWKSDKMRHGLVFAIAPTGLIDLLNYLDLERHRKNVLGVLRTDYLAARANAGKPEYQKNYLELVPYHWDRDLYFVYRLQMMIEAYRIGIAAELYANQHGNYPDDQQDLSLSPPVHSELTYQSHPGSGYYRVFIPDPHTRGKEIDFFSFHQR